MRCHRGHQALQMVPPLRGLRPAGLRNMSPRDGDDRHDEGREFSSILSIDFRPATHLERVRNGSRIKTTYLRDTTLA